MTTKPTLNPPPSETQATKLFYIHYAIDDKAIRHLKSLYAAALPGDHQFIIQRNSQAKLHNYKESNGAQHINLNANDKLVDPDYWSSKEMVNDLKAANVVIFHALHTFSKRVLEAIPANVLVVWNSWGADIWEVLPEFHEDAMCLPLTTRISNRYKIAFPTATPNKKNALRQSASRILRKLKTYLRPKPDQEIPAAYYWSKIDLFSGEMHDRLRALLPGFRAEQIQLSWYSIELLTKQSDKNLELARQPLGESIQIGHAAWPADNHAEAIEILSKCQIQNREFIIPLSYGCQSYAGVVEKLAVSKFGSKVKVLRDWLPLDEYNRIGQSVNTLILNSVAGVGFGNILVHLYRGGRVFLRRENPLRQLLLDNGIAVSCIDELRDYSQSTLTPLDAESISRNRTAIDAGWSSTSVKNRISIIADYANTLRITVPCTSRPTLWG